MKDVNDFKAAHYGDLQNLREEKQATEANNRFRFNEGRVNSQNRVVASMNRTFHSKRGAYNDIKDQQMRINDMVHNNNLNVLRDRQQKFAKVKGGQVRAKSHFTTVSNMN